MAYDRIPGVDPTFNFPPQIREAFAESFEFRQALLAALLGSESPVSEVLDQMAVDPQSPLALRLAQLVMEYPAAGGPEGPEGPAGSGVGPVVLGEKIMTSIVPSSGKYVNFVQWPGLTLTVTKGTKPIVVKASVHIRPVTPGVVTLQINDTNDTIVQAFSSQTGVANFATQVYGETITLNPPPGTYTYKVVIGVASGVQFDAIATEVAVGYPAWMKVVEQ